ncbi:MAG: Ger(x)C family spore germination protein [Firmicutes bacterium]|jgi:spore germination protein KC|nr:Ger(x)C family spore germination protein [Bacillota bacterium]HQD39868.1 Ger(x)C family spore germination protein [Bacillota bacterium]
MKRWILLLFCLCFLAGCWDRREINELAFVSSAAIDKDGDRWHVTVELFEPGGMQGEKSNSAKGRQGWLVEAAGESIFSAIRNLAKVVPRRVYWSHCQGIILGEEAAKEGLAEFLDFCVRDQEVRSSVLLFVSHGKAKKLVIETVGSIDDTLGLQLAGLANIAKLASSNLVTTVRDFSVDLATDGVSPMLCGLKLVPTKTLPGSFSSKDGDVKAASGVKVQLEGQALFRQTKMVGWLPENQVRGILWILNPPTGAIINVKVPGTQQRVSLELVKVRSNLQLKANGGERRLVIGVEGEISLGGQASSRNLNLAASARSLQRQCEAVIRNEIQQAIETAMKLQVDPFGFGHFIHTKDPKYWHRVRTNWPEKLPPISYAIEMKLVSSGLKTGGPALERRLDK